MFLLREQEAGDSDEAARGPQGQRQEGQSKPAGQQPQRNLQKPLKSRAVCPGQGPALSSEERPPTGQQGLWVHNGAGFTSCPSRRQCISFSAMGTNQMPICSQESFKQASSLVSSLHLAKYECRGRGQRDGRGRAVTCEFTDEAAGAQIPAVTFSKPWMSH